MTNMTTTTSSNRVVAAVKRQPKKPSKKSRVKQVLSNPVSLKFPTVSDEGLQQLKQTLVACAAGMKNKDPKPNWETIRKVEKTKRKQARIQYRNDYLEKLSGTERESFRVEDETRKEKWSHVILGHNKILRDLVKDEVSAVLIEKNETAALLVSNFLAVCAVKGIPLIAVDDLDKELQRDDCLGSRHSCIAIAFKKTVQVPGSCFHPLYEKMLQLLDMFQEKREDNECCTCDSDEAGTLINPKTTVKNVGRNKYDKLSPPIVDASKYHLTRTRIDQRAFTPGVGLNKQASADDTEFIVLKDYPDLDVGDAVTSFSFRAQNKRKFNPNSQRRERDVSSTVDTTESMVSIKGSLEGMFFLDVEGEADDQTTQALQEPERKHKRKTTQDYVPATVLRIAANVKRKKIT